MHMNQLYYGRNLGVGKAKDVLIARVLAKSYSRPSRFNRDVGAIDLT